MNAPSVPLNTRFAASATGVRRNDLIGVSNDSVPGAIVVVLLALVVVLWSGATCPAKAQGVAGTTSATSPATMPLALREEIVIPDASIGGVRMQVGRFTDPRDPAQLQAGIAQVWRVRPAPIMSSLRDGWEMLTQADGGWVETIGLRASPEGSEGIRIRVKAQSATARRDTRWLGSLLGANAVEVNRVDQRDGARRMTTSVWSVPDAPPGLVARLVQHAAARGLKPGKGMPEGHGEGTDTVLLAGRGEDLAATLSPTADGLAVVFHWSSKE